jgi:hypothetical protein
VNFTAFLASNMLAQFSRQIVVQILGLELKKGLWESRSMFTLVSTAGIANCWKEIDPPIISAH